MDSEEKYRLIKQITPTISIHTINEIFDYSINHRSVDMIGFSQLINYYTIHIKRECTERELRNIRLSSYH